MFFQTPTYVHENYLQNAFSEFILNSSRLKLVTSDGRLTSFNRNLLMFYSPLVKELLENVSEEEMIFLPECSLSSLEHLENVFIKGFTDFTAVQDIKDVSTVLGIELDNFDYAEKSVVENNIAKTRENESEKRTDEFGAAKIDNIVIKCEPIDPMVDVKEEPCDDLINETLEELSGYFSKNIAAIHENNSNKKCKLSDKEENAPESPTKGTKRAFTNDNDDFAKKIRGAPNKKGHTISKEVKDRSFEFVENEKMQNIVEMANSVEVCQSSKSSLIPPATQSIRHHSPGNLLQSETPSPNHLNLVSPTFSQPTRTPHLANPGQREHHQQSPIQLHQQSPQQLHHQQSSRQVHHQQQQSQIERQPQPFHLGYNSSPQQNEPVSNHPSYPQEIEHSPIQQHQHQINRQDHSQQHFQGQSTPFQQPTHSTFYPPQSSFYQQASQSTPYQQPPNIQQHQTGYQLHSREQMPVAVGDSENFVAKVKKAGGSRWGPPPPTRQPLSCYRCGKSGHFARNCWQ